LTAKLLSLRLPLRTLSEASAGDFSAIGCAIALIAKNPSTDAFFARIAKDAE
jgi:hypothetical protein